MNDFLRHAYHTAKQTYLNDLAHMQAQNDAYADQHGGEANLAPDKRRIFEGRRNKIIRMVQFHDRAQEYIEELENWIDEILKHNRTMQAQVTDARTEWYQHFPRLTRRAPEETQKEHHRHLTITELQLQMPHLF